MNIGEKIARMRNKNNMTQDDLALLLNVSRQTISNWELNISSPSFAQVSVLANTFEVSLDSLANNEAFNQIEERNEKIEKRAKIIIIFLKIVVCIYLLIFLISSLSLFKIVSNLTHSPNESEVNESEWVEIEYK